MRSSVRGGGRRTVFESQAFAKSSTPLVLPKTFVLAATRIVTQDIKRLLWLRWTQVSSSICQGLCQISGR